MTDEDRDLEAVARLAADVAHELNNLLTAIRGYAHLARGGLPEDSPAQEDIDRVMAAAERAAELTRQLAAAARKPMEPPG